MKKQIYDEKNGLWYELHGDYYLPCLIVPPEEQRPIGVWGQRHLRYLRQHRKSLYTGLLLDGKLDGYLADLNEQRSICSFGCKRTFRKGGSRKPLKAEINGMVRRMTQSGNATEIVNNDCLR
jgi:hypothetical protein